MLMADSHAVHLFSLRWLEKTLRAHQRCINSVHHTAGGLVTGGKDGFVKLWSTQLAHLKTFDLNEVNIMQATNTLPLVVLPMVRAHQLVQKFQAQRCALFSGERWPFRYLKVSPNAPSQGASIGGV